MNNLHFDDCFILRYMINLCRYGIFLLSDAYNRKKHWRLKMNSIENYLLFRSRTLAKSLAVGFLLNFIAAMAAFGLLYSAFKVFPPDFCVRIIHADPFTGTSGFIRGISEALAGSMITLALLFTSCFTVFSRRIILVLCLWQGASFGCTSALISGGLCSDVPQYTALSMMTAFLASCVFVFLASFSSVYADCIIRICSAQAYTYKKAVTQEFFLCFLTLSGVFLTLRLIQFVLLIF